MKIKKKRTPFIHLHNHSRYSVGDGLCSFDDIIQRVKENGQPAIAITDHYYCYDLMSFYYKAKEAGVKPIMGCELGIYPEGLSATLPKYDLGDDAKKNDKVVSYFHGVFLAKNMTGYKNLMKLASIASEDDRFYRKPRVKRKDIKKYHEGLIFSTACLASEVDKLILAGEDRYALKVIAWYHKIFGDDFYLEIQDHGIEAQEIVNKKLIAWARKYNLNLLLTNDTHYTTKELASSHRLLLCANWRQKFYDENSDINTKYFPTDEWYIKDNKEMYAIAKKWNCIDAYENTYKIYEKCNLEIPEETHFPKAQLEYCDNPDDELKYLIEKFKWNKYKKGKDCVYTATGERIETDVFNARIEKELSDTKLGKVADYFLNTYKGITKYCDENGIMIGAGRGSAAGSIISYILNITDVEPILLGLEWERFWNTGRCKFDEDGNIVSISLPDIDIDIPSDRRDEVMQHCREYFGEDRVANFITFGTYSGKNLVRAVGDALEIDKSVINKCCDYIPMSLSGALQSDEFLEYLEYDEEANALIEACKPLEGCIRNVSTHAAGMLIADKNMLNYTPYTYGKNGITTQYPYETMEHMGCLKVDLLGHEAEVFIDRACQYIYENHDVKIIPREIPNDDLKTFQMLQRCDSRGVPQIEKNWILDIMKDIHPESINHIIDLVTMIRPGSLDSGQTDKYRAIRLGKIEAEPDIPQVENITKDTYHCLSKDEKIFGHSMTIGQMYASGKYGTALSMKEDGILSENVIEGIRYAGKQDVYLVKTKDNKTIKCTLEHKFPTPKGEKKLKELKIGDELYVKSNDEMKVIDSTYKKNIIALCKCGRTFISHYGRKTNCGCCDVISQNKLYLLEDEKTVRCYTSNNEHFYVDVDGIEKVQDSNWFISMGNSRTRYVISNTYGFLHNYLTDDKYACVNHKDFNGLNDCMYNLEGCSVAKNQQYRQLNNSNTTGYMGVYERSKGNKQGKPYRAAFTHNYVNKQIGTYDSALEAAVARDNYIKEYNKLNGTNYNLNFPILKYAKDLDSLRVIQRIMNKEVYFTEASEIVSIEYLGEDDVFDVSMKHPYHNFLVKSGIVTSNCWLYQESVMRATRELAGFTLEQADTLRKVVAKTKYADKAEGLMKLFKEGCLKGKGTVGKLSHEEWEIMDKIIRDFFKYGFNKAHGAGYGITSYRCAYLKANYFIEFMTALINSKPKDDLPFYLDNIYEHGYIVNPPDINVCGYYWTCKDGELRPPLSVIRNCGPSAVSAIIEERELNGEYTSYEDFIARTPSNAVKQNTIESLIMAGVFDSMGYTRKTLHDSFLEEYHKDIRKNGITAELPTGGDEFTIGEIQEDEQFLFGFIISLSDDEIAKRQRKIIRHVKKYRDVKVSNSSGRVLEKAPDKKIRKSLNERKRKIMNEIDEEMDSENVYIRVSSKSKKDLTKVYATVLKYSKLDKSKQYNVNFLCDVHDGNTYEINTDTSIGNKCYKALREKLGEDNVYIE